LILLSDHAVRRIVIYVLSLPLMYYVMNQVKKPTKWVGRLFTSIMNLTHSGVTDWGLKHVEIKEDFTILDVGCGGGRTIGKLAAFAIKGVVHGIDYADGSVAASCGKNAQLIKEGRVDIKKASVSQLPFAQDQFNLVTAVETQYYWPDLVKDMQEILRVLKPGGTLVVIAESYKHGAFDTLQGPVMKLLGSKSMGVDDHRELFSTAGYTDVQIFEERRKGWLCGMGKKPI
jgi:ubiquinone/menaquinone biosynthesis C-methylase UbiE